MTRFSIIFYPLPSLLSCDAIMGIYLYFRIGWLRCASALHWMRSFGEEVARLLTIKHRRRQNIFVDKSLTLSYNQKVWHWGGVSMRVCVWVYALAFFQLSKGTTWLPRLMGILYICRSLYHNVAWFSRKFFIITCIFSWYHSYIFAKGSSRKYTIKAANCFQENFDLCEITS